VSKIVGQGGSNINRLVEETGCRVAVNGRGSIYDKKKVLSPSRLYLLGRHYYIVLHSAMSVLTYRYVGILAQRVIVLQLCNLCFWISK